jgi:drug/metabolite transporter (DMT)-like permease
MTATFTTDNSAPPLEGDPLLPKKDGESANAATNAEEESLPFEEHIGMVESVLDVITEGVELLVDNVQAAVENAEELGADWRESVVESYHDVTDALVQEMSETDYGDNFFLEMSLARNLSILPTDIVSVAQTDLATAVAPTAEQEEDRDEEQELTVPHAKVEAEPEQVVTTPLSAYLMLASAVLALSAIGPLLELQVGCTPTMKIAWRMSATAMLLFPFAVYSVRQSGLPHLSCSQWTILVLAAASYATMCVGFVLALQYTSVGNAVILSNSQAIMLLAAKFFVGDRVSLMEGSGAILSFFGAVLCSKDSSETKLVGEGSPADYLTLLGDLFALIAGLAGVFYLVFAKAIRNNLGLYPFMFLIMAVGSFLTLLFQIFVLREEVAFSRDANIGIWGWMNLVADRFPLEVIMVVLW